MKLRSMFNKIFGGGKSEPAIAHFQALNEFGPIISGYTGSDIYESDIVRTCVDAVAKNAAKLTAKHVRRINGEVKTVNGNLAYLLQVRPNEYMSAYDMFYKTVSQLYTHNNAYIYIRRNEMGVPVGFYPLNYATLETVECNGEMFCRFYFMSSHHVTVPYSDLIHLRRHFNRNDLYGEDNTGVFKPTLSLMKTINDGLVEAIKSSARLRGWLKFSAQVRPEDLKAAKDRFVSDYLDIKNSGGIAAIDAKYDFVPAKMEYSLADEKQMAFVRENIYRFFGLNESIITGNYNETQWAAFYESIIEPIAIQLSLEFTAKLFTDRELGHGNEVVFEANRLQYASPQTKVQLIKELLPLGMMTLNEAREVLNLAPVDGGEKRLVSLNYVNADRADEYQLGNNRVVEGEKDGEQQTDDEV